MTSVEVIKADSPLLKDVQRLWRENSEGLGFLPAGAFIERATEKGQVLAATDGTSVAGYVLFYIDKRSKVRITHLCVDHRFRRKQIAKQLIDALRVRTKSCRGIGLHCRRDFDAWHIWPKLGFHAVSEKIGRSKDGHELTFFWLDHPHRSLFSLTPDIEDDRLTVVLDANIFYDLDDPSRNGAEETQGIVADWIQPLIQICITPELFNEIQRNPDADQRKRHMAEARKYECLDCETDDFHVANQLVRALLGEPQAERDESDKRHVARAIASKAEAFVTRDGPLLDHADEIYERCGLSVVRPSQLVAWHEELRNERDYQRNRLAGSDIQTCRVSGEAERLADNFRLADEKQRDLASFLNNTFANPVRFQCQYITTSVGKPLALYVVEQDGGKPLDICLFRISRNVLQTRLAGTLARTLLTDIVQEAVTKGNHVVRLSEANLGQVLVDALQDRGFINTDQGWLKLSLVGVVEHGELANLIGETAASSGIGDALISDLLSVVKDRSFPSDIEAVLGIEHVLWPGKIAGSQVPNFVVPIRPNWATDLFDAGLAKNRLWGADTELALNPDSVYYRAIKPRVLRDRGRLLWYVSEDKHSGSKMIRACSQITDLVLGKPKDIFRRFRRFGVYDWQNVLDTAKSLDGQLMAVQFTDTELFTHPIKWEMLQTVLQKHGKNYTFPSPVAVEEELFFDLYRLGIANEA